MSSQPIGRKITVQDLRSARPPDAKKQIHINIKDSSLGDLKQYLIDKTKSKEFVICLPNRMAVNEEIYDTLTTGQVLIIIESPNQKLSETVKYEVNIAPHPDTITKSGMYEYYDSRGIDSVVISIAELIDNSLSATKNNNGLRLIDIRYYDIDREPMVVIIDNGKGMNFNDLNDWAKFKHSKFVRKKGFESDLNNTLDESGIGSEIGFSSNNLPINRPKSPDPSEYRPRYLDSEINFFGAGGKQAIFNIGSTTTMITKASKTNDVFELTLSKDRFDEKSITNPDAVYKEELTARPKGMSRTLSKDPKDSERIENQIIEETEKSYKNFTICCIKNVFDRHQKQFKMNTENTKYWTKGLARIYHYYLHGPNGNTGVVDNNLPQELKDINIVINIYGFKKNGNQIQTPIKHKVNLKDINTDFETLLVRSAKDMFEFQIDHLDKASHIEGIVRYHPYLHDKETIPVLNIDEDLGETSSHISAKTGENEFDIEDTDNSSRKSRHREVFECFWHGRLIPQDCIDFDWNKFNPKNANCTKDLEECFNRLSGALFTNCAFQVSQNKQSFMDLNKLMTQKDRLTFFRIADNGHRKRGKFETEFLNWIKSCHTRYDKQVSYKEYQGEIPRNEFPSLRSSYTLADNFSIFNTIEWKEKVWKRGHKILTQNTKPQKLIGSIEKFLVPVRCSKDYVGSPGLVEVYLLPSEIYGKGSEASKILKFSQIKFEATIQSIDEEFGKSFVRLPAVVELAFPERYPIKSGDKLRAGHPIGAIQVKLKNSNGDYLKSDRIPYKTSHKKLSIQLEIHRITGKETEVEVEYPISNWDRNWDFWFLENKEGIEKTGKYRIVCVCLNSSTNATEPNGMFADGSSLPVAENIEFEVIPNSPKHFNIIEENPKALIGKPIDLTLELMDEFKNIVEPNPDIHSPILKMKGFEAKFERLEKKGNKLVLKNVIVLGQIKDNENPILEILLPSIGMKNQVIIGLQTGNPSKIGITPEQPIEFMNGTVPEFGALLYDMGGNEVTFDKQNQVFCTVLETKPNDNRKTKVSPELVLTENMFRNKRSLILEKEIAVKATERPFSSRTFLMRFYMKTDPRVQLEKQLVLKKSCKPAFVRLFFDSGSESIEILKNKRLEFPAASALSGVYFKAYECDETEIDLSSFNDNTIRITWSEKPIIISPNGMLPNILIHKDTQEIRHMNLSWKQMTKNIDIDFSFYLKPFPDSAQRMTITSDSHSLSFPVGQEVTQPIHVSVFDAFNNTIRSADILSRLSIKPIFQSLVIDNKCLKKVIPNTNNNISYVISHIKLLPNQTIRSEQTVIGEQILQFSIEGLDEINESLKVNVVNGIPHCLKWFNASKNNCQTLTNNRKLQIQAQVVDQFNNPVIDTKLLVKLIFGQNLTTRESSVETDSNGVAVFDEKIHINSNSNTRPKCEIPAHLRTEIPNCKTKCFGFNKIYSIVKYKQKLIKSEEYFLHILCDDKNPMRIDIKIHGKPDVIADVDPMPTFTVKLFAENDRSVANFDLNRISMHLMLANEPNNYQKISPKLDNKDPTLFRFSINKTPKPNKYYVKIVVTGSDNNIIERTFEEYIDVIPGPAVKLALKSEPLKQAKVVTNSGQNRAIIDSKLCLDLVDANNHPIYENIIQSDLDGSRKYSGHLNARIVRCETNSDLDLREVPELDRSDANNQLIFPIKRGRVEIKESELMLRENTRGINHNLYSIEFWAQLRDGTAIREPFIINIMFCDDTQRQEHLNQLQNENLEYTQRISRIEAEVKSKALLIEKQTEKYREIRIKEQNISEKLKNEYKESSGLTDEQRIKNKINEFEKRLNDMNVEESKRTIRGIDVSIAPKREGVFGRIAHLGYIRDDEKAKRISWFLREHMDCVITQTSVVAQKLCEEEGYQPTLALDRIPLETPSYVCPLPHYINETKYHFYFSGNICYARSLIEVNKDFPEMKNEFQRVFTSILNNTLIIDDLDSAKDYVFRWRRRQESDLHFVGKCPTIIANDGIIYESGIVDPTLPSDDNYICFQSPPNSLQLSSIKVKNCLQLLKEYLKAYKQRVKENDCLEEMKKEFEEFENQKRSEKSELETSIASNRTQFHDISNASLEQLDQSIHRRRDSFDTSHRRSGSGSPRGERHDSRPRDVQRRRRSASNSRYSEFESTPKRFRNDFNDNY